MRRIIIVAGLCAAASSAFAATFASDQDSPRAHSLSMREAVNDALASNVQTLLAKARRAEAHGNRVQARAAFLPHLSGDVSQSRQRVNLAAQGFNLDLPGFSPLITYNSFEARAQLRQSLFDYSAWEHYQGARIGENVANARLTVARQQVATQAELDYVAVLAAGQSVHAAQADLVLADKLLQLARDQEHNGLATGVDVTRAQARQARAQARLAQARTDHVRTRIQLERTVGLPLDSPLVLASTLDYRPVALGDTHTDITHALSDRAEMRLDELRIRQGRKELAAARGARLPRVSVSAAYGMAGNTYDQHSDTTYAVGAQITLPIFDGGAINGRIDSASSQLNQQRIRYQNTRRQIEQDVRVARRTLRTLGQRVRAARAGLRLAKEELQRSRDRFRHGVNDNLEVVDAQSSLANARDTHISALAEYARARINLAAALGRAQQFDLQHPMTP